MYPHSTTTVHHQASHLPRQPQSVHHSPMFPWSRFFVRVGFHLVDRLEVACLLCGARIIASSGLADDLEVIAAQRVLMGMLGHLKDTCQGCSSRIRQEMRTWPPLPAEFMQHLPAAVWLPRLEVTDLTVPRITVGTPPLVIDLTLVHPVIDLTTKDVKRKEDSSTGPRDEADHDPPHGTP